MTTKLLTNEFIEKYPDFPGHMNALGQFVYYRTYSRFLPEKGRRETWKETVRRAVEYNVGLSVKHTDKIGYPVDVEKHRKEAEELFDSMFNLRQFLSGRTMWIGGADGGVAEKYPLANFNCFSRDTEFITDQGVKSFEDFEDGDKANVLVKTGGWREATVTKFGKSEIVEMTVRKGRRVDKISTTANHLWFVDKGGKWRERKTEDLQVGDVLRTKKRYENNSPAACSIGIMHGIIFGDGTYDKKAGSTRIHLCNEKRSLAPYVFGGNVIEYEKDNQTIITGLPHFMKKLPTEGNIEYKFGFLLGLIATDGHVNRNNTTISSSSLEVIKFVRDTAILCGIVPGVVQEIDREGFGVQSKLYQISLAAADLKKEYFLREKHRAEFNETDKRFGCKVESIEYTGRYEDVWCVQEPETQTFTLANGVLTHNCSFVNIRSWSDLGDLFYLLLVGTGVGFKCTKEFAANLAPIRTNTTLINAPYEPVPKERRLENSKLTVLDNGYAKIYVGDSKEGWVESLRLYFDILTKPEYEEIHTIKVSYNSVRPLGERLKTFGGTASGHEPLAEMFAGIDRVLKNEIDPSLAPLKFSHYGEIDPIEQHVFTGDYREYRKVRPIHILDIGNLIGNNVVVGGVRRTAEIFLMDADDYESIFAKYGINGLWSEKQFEQHDKIHDIMIGLDIPVPNWFDEVGKRNYDANVNKDATTGEPLPYNFGRPLHHRRMSNNSVAFTEKPSREILNLIFEMMQAEGEPGFINLEEANRRRPNAEGLNPCAEILLDSYGVCNLTTVNMVEFVRESEGEHYLDVTGLIEAQRHSARAGLRMTLAELELPHWNAIQQRDRLLGTSLTGVKDAMALLDYTEEEEAELLELLGQFARDEADEYAKELRVNSPLLVTTVKPEGTISQVAGGVSSGLHWSHSPYYIRRIRINAADPLAKAVQSIGWPVSAEVGTLGINDVEQLRQPHVIASARTLVIDFPVASGASRTKDDVSAAEQFDTYFRFQRHYTEHNSSNTIHVRPDEWATAEDIVWNGWDEFTAVSFLAYDGGSYVLAPYEAITKEQYEELAAKLTEFDPDILQRFESGQDSDLDGMDGCDAGVCPVR
jgi:ribonucleoside-triphosphate reductase (thioredoxin)